MRVGDAPGHLARRVRSHSHSKRQLDACAALLAERAAIARILAETRPVVLRDPRHPQRTGADRRAAREGAPYRIHQGIRARSPSSVVRVFGG